MNAAQPSETVASYREDGVTFEIDHLGIGCPDQWGEFAVYRGDVQVAEFSTTAAGYLPEYRVDLPETAMLIALSKQAVADIAADAAGG